MRKPEFRRVVALCECETPEEMRECNGYERYCKKRYYNEVVCDHCRVVELDSGAEQFRCDYGGLNDQDFDEGW